jgi:hypothetical protein
LVSAPSSADRSVGAGEKQGAGGLGRDRDDLDVTVGQAADRLAGGKLRIRMDHAGAAFRLRQHDRVGTCGHDGIEIGVGEPGRKSVDANQQARPARRLEGVLQKSRRAFPGIVLAVRRNRILEVDDDGVGAARHGLVELPAAVGWDEEK